MIKIKENQIKIIKDKINYMINEYGKNVFKNDKPMFINKGERK